MRFVPRLAVAALLAACVSSAPAQTSPYLGEWNCTVVNTPPAHSQSGTWSYVFNIDIKSDNTMRAEGDYLAGNSKTPFTAEGTWRLESGGLVVEGTARKADGDGPFMMLALEQGPDAIGYTMSTEYGTLASSCTR